MICKWHSPGRTSELSHKLCIDLHTSLSTAAHKFTHLIGGEMLGQSQQPPLLPPLQQQALAQRIVLDHGLQQGEGRRHSTHTHTHASAFTAPSSLTHTR